MTISVEDLALSRLRSHFSGWDRAPRDDQRRAAVALVLRPASGSAEALLIKRAKHPNDPWSGHMALPGGRVDAADPSVLDAAIRETHEELGIDLQSADLLGGLDELPAMAKGKRVGMTISPFVFALQGPVSVEPNYEVEQAYWFSLADLVDPARQTHIDYDHEGTMLKLPAVVIEDCTIWGLTYRMLETFFDQIGVRRPRRPAR